MIGLCRVCGEEIVTTFSEHSKGPCGKEYFPVKRRAMFSHISCEWSTPKAFYEELNKEFQFDFDPCPLGGSEDGRSPLFVPWKGRRVFCNPPYGPEIPQFLARAKEAELAVFLLPARTDVRWFHDICLPTATEIRFIRGRLRFGDSRNPAPFPSMVVVFARTVNQEP